MTIVRGKLPVQKLLLACVPSAFLLS